MGEELSMAPRIVREAEHLDALAYRHGVTPGEVWNAPVNAALKAARPGGHMLQAGDFLELPARVHPEPVDVKVGSETRIVATIPRVPVELVLAEAGQPLAGEPWRIEGRGERASGTTGSDGRVAFAVRVTTPRVVLHLERRKQIREIAVGGLDPHESLSGAAQRLRNLGFDAGAGRTLTPELSAALRAFQEAKRLPNTGRPDAETLAALAAAHGS
jgi:hypothetical protein